MRIIVVGAGGTIGSAVAEELAKRHEVIGVSRHTDPAVDLTDESSIRDLYRRVGRVDAVVACTGTVAFRPLAELSHEDLVSAFADKALGQIDLVRVGMQEAQGAVSYTLTSGILSRNPIATGTAASLVNGAIDSFVTAAATQLPAGGRINAVSPTVLAEAPGFHASFPGFPPVAAADVAQAYVRSVEGVETGRTFPVG